MTDKQYSRTKLSAVCSYQAYQWLDNWIKQKHITNPYPPAPKDYFYRNTVHRQYLSKFIESVMVKVLKGMGADPQKAPDKGRYVDKTSVITNVIHQRQIGSGKWVHQKGVRKGRADVQCFFNGDMYNLEVKVGKDRLSDDQKAEKIRAEANGERYEIITCVDDFLKLIG